MGNGGIRENLSWNKRKSLTALSVSTSNSCLFMRANSTTLSWSNTKQTNKQTMERRNLGKSQGLPPSLPLWPASHTHTHLREEHAEIVQLDVEGVHQLLYLPYNERS